MVAEVGANEGYTLMMGYIPKGPSPIVAAAQLLQNRLLSFSLFFFLFNISFMFKMKIADGGQYLLTSLCLWLCAVPGVPASSVTRDPDMQRKLKLQERYPTGRRGFYSYK